MTVRAVVINIHHHGATVRLSDGTLAAISKDEFAAHRAAYVAGYDRRTVLDLVLSTNGRHRAAGFATLHDGANVPSEPPRLTNAAFEERMSDYLRSRTDRGASAAPDAAERHFIRKKRRAAWFEARTPAT